MTGAIKTDLTEGANTRRTAAIGNQRWLGTIHHIRDISDLDIGTGCRIHVLTVGRAGREREHGADQGVCSEASHEVSMFRAR